MRVLVLGGTAFLGRHLVEAALAGGHEVTVFTRGHAAHHVPEAVEHLVGDRETDLGLLDGREFDTVIDTSGYVPRVVRTSACALAPIAERYVFVSTISVYEDVAVLDESTPTRTLAEAGEEDPNVVYGPLKAACEEEVERAFPGRALMIRPGLIVGRYDYTGRFSYWPRRVARGGEVLAPGKPDARVWLIDARDLAEWTLRLVESGQTGIYNAAGPGTPLTLGELLEDCRQIAASDARFTWVGEDFLLEHGVTPYTELPLWVPEQGGGYPLLDLSKAVAAGLTYRPIGETIREVLEWEPGPDDERSPPFGFARPEAGLTPERELSLLEAWRSL